MLYVSCSNYSTLSDVVSIPGEYRFLASCHIIKVFLFDSFPSRPFLLHHNAPSYWCCACSYFTMLNHVRYFFFFWGDKVLSFMSCFRCHRLSSTDLFGWNACVSTDLIASSTDFLELTQIVLYHPYSFRLSPCPWGPFPCTRMHLLDWTIWSIFLISYLHSIKQPI